MKRIARIAWSGGIILTFCMISMNINGQGATQQEIDAFARRQAAEFSRKKEEAVRVAVQKGWTVRKEYPDGRIIEIMELAPNGMPVYNLTDNLDAAITVGTDELWTGGSSGLNLTGDGFTVAEWDGGGIRTNHQEFRVGIGPSRVTQMDAPASNSSHSTHVAGTLIAEGQAADAHGMAPEADLHAYEWNDDIAEMLNANSTDNIILSNHSYDQIRGWYEDLGIWYWFGDTTINRYEDYLFGFYGAFAKTWDSMAYVMPDFLFVKSAGNDRNDDHHGGHYVYKPSTGNWVWSTTHRDPDGGADHYDCIGNRGVAKNILTVGAVNDIPGGYSVPGDVTMSTFSSWGHTDDGRIKPDIVANGVGVYSTDDDADNDYDTKDGTSMASPNVCGTLALLQDYYFDIHGTYMYADVLKALVINTADEAGANNGPDYQFGWGLLDAEGAGLLIQEDSANGQYSIRRRYLSNGETEEFTYYSDGNSPIIVTICWTDPPGTPPAPSLNPGTIMLEHDLDLRVIEVDGNVTTYPWRLDPANPGNAATRNDNIRDNVETVTILNPDPGAYTIRVDHEGAISGQYYGLVISGLSPTRYTNTWQGDISTAWNTSGNWSLDHVPVSAEIVVIPNTTNDPVIAGIAFKIYAECYSIEVQAGAELKINYGELDVASDMNLYGLLRMINDNAELIIHDDMFVRSGATADFLAYSSITVYDDWTFYSGANFVMADGVVVFEGTEASSFKSYDSDCAVNTFYVNKSGGGYIEFDSLSTYPLRVNYQFYININGEFRCNESNPVIVKGNFYNNNIFNLTKGTFIFDGTTQQIWFNTPGYFYNLTISPSSTVTMIDTIDVNGNLLIEQGTLNPNGKVIYLAGNWTNSVGTSGFTEGTSKVVFNNTTVDQYIKSSETFNILEVNMTGALRVDNAASAVLCNQYNWTAGGINVMAGSFTANDLVDNGIFGKYWLSTGGTINLTQGSSEYIDLNGELHITGGNMNVYGGLIDSYWPYLNPATIEMSGGVLDFKDQGIYLSTDDLLTDNITGGTIRTKEGFTGIRTDFNPIAGTIELYSTTNGSLSHGAGSNFYNVIINKSALSDEDSGEDRPVPGMETDGEGSIQEAMAPIIDPPRRKEPPLNRSNTVTLASNLTINGDLTITNGVLDASASNYGISLAGDWTNNVGTAGFVERNGMVTFIGNAAKDINTSETYYNLILNKTYSGSTGLEFDNSITVAVTGDLTITDGTLEMNPNSVLDIGNDLSIALNAGLNANDIPTTIYIGGDWTNDNTSYTSIVGFNPGNNSTVTFDGPSNQLLITSCAAEEFFNLIINKSNSFRTYENIRVIGDMTINAGSWWDATGMRSHYFYGDFTVSPGCGFDGSMGCTVNFNGSADQVITFDPSLCTGYLYHTIIDKSVVAENRTSDDEGKPKSAFEDGSDSRSNIVTLATDVIGLNDASLTINYGTLDLNGHYYRCTGDVKINNGGKLAIDAAAWLEVGGSDSLQVNNGGILEVIGVAGNDAMIRAHSGNYAFDVKSGGTIRADHATFKEMGANGLNVQSGATIDATYKFDHCTFRDGYTGAGTLLKIENSQVMTIDSANFPTSTTTNNVTKIANQGDLTFTNPLGTYAGPAHENDPNSRIQWAGSGIWDGSVSTDWYTAGNWSWDFVPDAVTDASIPSGCPNYPVVNSVPNKGKCKNLTIATGASLTISSDTLDVNGSVTVNGILTMNSTSARLFVDGDMVWGNSSSGSMTGNARMYVYGNWEFLNGANVMLNSGYVQFEGSSISWIRVYDSDCSFYHLFNNKTSSGSMRFSNLSTENTLLKGSLYNYGAVYQYTTVSDSVIVKGFMNNVNANAHFYGMDGTLAFTGTAGSITFKPNLGDYFNNLVIKSTSQLNLTNTYSDSLVIHGDLLIGSGTSGTSGINTNSNTIVIGGNWTNNVGSSAFVEGTGTVIFNGSTDQYCNGETFYNLRVDKSSGSLIFPPSSMPVESRGGITTCSNLDWISGALSVTGGTVNVNDPVFILDKSLTISSGYFYVHDSLSFTGTGVLTINGGNFVNDRSFHNGIVRVYGTLNLSSGTFEMTDNNLSFQNTFTDNISGGTMRLGGTLAATTTGTLQPSGGTTEFIGTLASCYIQLAVGNYLYDMTVNRSVPISVYSTDPLTIKRHININGGGLTVTSNHIYVGGNWTNTVGSAGFAEGTSRIHFNGLTRQTINGETFYLVDNQNTSDTLVIAGSTNISSNFAAAAGGGACKILVTCPSLQILGQLILPSGSLTQNATGGSISAASFDQGGTVKVKHGSFTVNDIVENSLQGTYILEADSINLYQDPSGILDFDGNITIYGGKFKVLGGNDNSYWPYVASASLTMTGGEFDFVNVGIVLFNNNFTENITGGTIRTRGTFNCVAACTNFTPAGGAVELYGNSANSDVVLQPGNYFYNLLINKGPDKLAQATGAFTVHNQLKIKSGSFKTNGYLITVGP